MWVLVQGNLDIRDFKGFIFLSFDYETTLV